MYSLSDDLLSMLWYQNKFKDGGIELYRSNSEAFYNHYIPSKYKNINTPEDRGQYMLNFNMHVNNFQPLPKLVFLSNEYEVIQ